MADWREKPGQEITLSRFAGLSPYGAAAKSGCDFLRGYFRVPLFHRVFRLFHPMGEVVEEGDSAPPPPWLHLLLLHYLITADGTPEADSWITYRHLPGALLFEGKFQGMAVHPLAQRFGRDREGFRRACLALRGEEMSRTGDASFRFLALPRVVMGVVLYLGDEELPGSASILFDASAPRYLPTEDLSYLGTYLARVLINYR